MTESKFQCGHCLDNMQRPLRDFANHLCTQGFKEVEVLHEEFIIRTGTNLTDRPFKCGICGGSKWMHLKDFGKHECTQRIRNLKIEGVFVFESDLVEQAQAQQVEAQQAQAQQVEAHRAQVQPVEEPQKKVWTNPMVKLLLITYKEIKEKYDAQEFYNKKEINKKITQELANHGYTVTIDQVKTKLRSLQNTYKEKLANKGPNQSGRGTLRILFETEMHEAFSKQHSINPTHLLGPNWEYTKHKDNSSNENDNNSNDEQAIVSSEKSNDISNNTDTSESVDHSMSIAEPDLEKEEEHAGNVNNKANDSKNKKRKYNYELRISEKAAATIRHKENLAIKNAYCELKREEIQLKKEKNKNLLDLTESLNKQKIELRQKELALKEKKYNFLYKDVQQCI